MKKSEKVCSLGLFALAMVSLLLSSVSCTPLFLGQVACQGALLVAKTAAVSSAESHDNNNNLNLKSSVTAFNEDFQFETYPQALVFISPDKRKEFWSEADRFQGKINITGFEVRDIELDKNKNQATILLHFEYWLTVSPIVKELSLKQKWQYFPKDKRWIVSDSGYDAFPSNSH